MDVLRYLVAMALLGGLCGLAWRLSSGRWRWLAGAVAFECILVAVTLSEPRTIDSWGVVPGAAWVFGWAVLIAGVLLGPAILIWSRARGRRRLFAASIALGVAWAFTVYILFGIPAVKRFVDDCIWPEEKITEGPEGSGHFMCVLGPE